MMIMCSGERTTDAILQATPSLEWTEDDDDDDDDDDDVQCRGEETAGNLQDPKMRKRQKLLSQEDCNPVPRTMNNIGYCETFIFCKMKTMKGKFL